MHAEIGRSMLEGSVLYVDRIDVNPPLIFYLYAALAYVAGLFEADFGRSFHLLVGVQVLYSALALYWLLREPRPSAALWLVIATWVSFSVLVLAYVDFGQREHLFMLGYVPWLYSRERRYSGGDIHWAPGLVRGAAGTLSALLKPHFLVVAVALELWMLCRTRCWSALRSIDVCVFGLGVTAYLGHFAFLPMAVQHAYLGRWLPFIVGHYGAFNCNLVDLLWRGLVPLVAIVAGVGFFAARGVVATWRLRCEISALGTMLGIGIFLIQHKGWGYHLYPALGFLSLHVSTLLAVLFEQANCNPRCEHSARGLLGRAMVAGASVAVITGAALAHGVALRNFSAEVQRVARLADVIEGHSLKGDAILFIATGVDPGYPALMRLNRRPGSRYLHAFPIPMLYRDVRTQVHGFPYRMRTQQPPAEEAFLAELGRDVIRYRPALIFVCMRDPCDFCPSGFRVYDYLNVVGWQEEYMKDYQLLRTIGRFAVYRRAENTGGVGAPDSSIHDKIPVVRRAGSRARL